MPSWRKSSFSDTPDSDCIEIAHDHPHVLIRDSKNPAGPVLNVTYPQWMSLLSIAQQG
jgi:Domain of unknown function (DUF397)